MARYLLTRSEGAIGKPAALLIDAAVAAIMTGEESINQRALPPAGYAGPSERRRMFERELTCVARRAAGPPAHRVTCSVGRGSAEIPDALGGGDCAVHPADGRRSPRRARQTSGGIFGPAEVQDTSRSQWSPGRRAGLRRRGSRE
jgi:hypothetical protein